MAFTKNGLTNSGITTHYQFQYDDSLQQTTANPGGLEPARTNQVIAACEADFNLINGWFGNIPLDVDFPIPVNVTQNGGGAGWSLSGRNLNVTINPANGTSTLVRYLLVSEMVEQFMRAQGLGWFGQGTEGSQGEGLSRFLAAQFLTVNGLGATPAGFDNSKAWLSSGRADFVNHPRGTDDGPDAATGCSLLFIYYLFSQLGFSLNRIVAAGANTLSGVYRNLTGSIGNPFPQFKHLLDIGYPGTSAITGSDLDNPYPIGKEIVWHHSSTNETQIWFMHGQRIVRRATVMDENGAAIFIGPPWHIVGTSDMDNAGNSNIVWYNSSTNETQLWFMNGERIVRRATVVDENGAAIFIGPPWHTVGTGDMDNEGNPYIVWYNSSTNETQIWFMNGERIVRRETVVDENGGAIFIGPPWYIVGIGDTDGGGNSDIVWHNSSTNETQIWFMNGERIARRETVVAEDGAAIFIGPPWHIVGIGDMDGTGNSEIVWYNSSTNETQIWFMNGERIVRRATVVAENGAPIFIGPPWRIVGAGDMNRAGDSDIVWHNNLTNDIQFWFMDGPRIKGRNNVVDEAGNLIRVGTPWKIAGAAGLATEAAVLWHNSATNDMQFWFMDGPRIKGRNNVVDEAGNLIRVGTPWNIAGVVGFATEAAILWHNNLTNDIQFWFMDGPRIKGRDNVVDEAGNLIRVGTPWNIVGVVGFATEAAILWHNNATNDMQFWFMDGPRIKDRINIVDEGGNLIRVGTPWNIVGVVGFATEAAILWHNNATNDMQFWFMDGPRIKGRNNVVDEAGNLIRVGTPWNIAGATG